MVQPKQLDGSGGNDKSISTFESIIDRIPAKIDEGTLQIKSLHWITLHLLGRIAIGRVKVLSKSALTYKADGVFKRLVKGFICLKDLVNKVAEFVEGLFIAVCGVQDFEIGDTLADLENPEPLARIAIDEPTMNMLFTINNSPFFGKEGKFVTSRHLRDRLFKEMEKNLALRVETTDNEDKFLVYGRGILHLSVLIETMRREGYELQVGQPQVIFKEIDGVKNEPIETLVVDVPETTAGKVIELATQRKGELLIMEPKGDLQHLEFKILPGD